MGKWTNLALLTAIWLLAILLINPMGEFPLNDDFSYARSTLNLSEGGILRYDPWLSMTLLAQVLWGTAFCKLFGFSFTVLRCSTLVLGWVGLVHLHGRADAGHALDVSADEQLLHADSVCRPRRRKALPEGWSSGW